MAKGKGRTNAQIPKDETKAARFVRVVTPRIGKAIKAIKTVGYCSGSTYEYKPEQVQQILAALSAEVVSLKAQFDKKQDKQTGFEFKP